MRFNLYVGIIILLLFPVVIYGLDISVDNINKTQSEVVVELILTNDSQIEYWFHYDSGSSLKRMDGNILYYAPNYSYYVNYHSPTILYDIGMVNIKPHKTIKRIFYIRNEEGSKKINLEESTVNLAVKNDFSRIEFINISLVFFKKQITVPIIESVYSREIFMEGVVKSVMCQVR